MAPLPGLAITSLAKDPTTALVSVSSLVLRNSLISAAKVVVVSELARTRRRSVSWPRASDYHHLLASRTHSATWLAAKYPA